MFSFSPVSGSWTPFNPETVRLMIGEFTHDKVNIGYAAAKYSLDLWYLVIGDGD